MFIFLLQVQILENHFWGEFGSFDPTIAALYKEYHIKIHLSFIRAVLNRVERPYIWSKWNCCTRNTPHMLSSQRTEFETNGLLTVGNVVLIIINLIWNDCICDSGA